MPGSPTLSGSRDLASEGMLSDNEIRPSGRTSRKPKKSLRYTLWPIFQLDPSRVLEYQALLGTECLFRLAPMDPTAKLARLSFQEGYRIAWCIAEVEAILMSLSGNLRRRTEWDQSAKLATWMDQKMIELRKSTIGVPIAPGGTPTGSLPRKRGEDVWAEIGGRHLLHFTEDGRDWFRHGIPNKLFVTPTPYGSEESVNFLNLEPGSTRTFAVVLDPRRIPGY